MWHFRHGQRVSLNLQMSTFCSLEFSMSREGWWVKTTCHDVIFDPSPLRSPQKNLGGKVMNGCMLPLEFFVYQQHVVQRMFVTVKHVLLDALLLRDHAYICERAGFDLLGLLAKLSIKEWIAFDFPMQTNKGKENSYKVRSLRIF